MTNTVNIFWTGGWDSTFRVLYLLIVERRSVQPFYVIDPNRRSTLQEIDAMRQTRNEILRRIGQDLLLPLKCAVRSDYPIPNDIGEAFDSIHRDAHIGRQYKWLPAFCAAEGISDIELCMCRYTPDSALQRLIFNEEGERRKDTICDPRGALLFERMALPTINLTKEKMAEVAAEHDFLHMMNKTWTCHRPIVGMPCGICNPCKWAPQRQQHYAISPLRFFVTPARRAGSLIRLASNGFQRKS